MRIWRLRSKTRGRLHPELAQAARQEEIRLMQKMCDFEASMREEYICRVGRLPVSTRWAGIETGGDGHVAIRSPLAARDSSREERTTGLT